MEEHKHGPDDVLVMGTDGLWDVTTDGEVADAVSAYLSCCDPSDPMRCAVCQIILYVRIFFLLCVLSCQHSQEKYCMKKCFVVLGVSTRW